MKLTWLGHSTVVLDLDGTRLLTDPLLRRHAGVLRRATAPPEPAQWAGTDAVLLSHLHHDHAELASLRLLGSVPMITAEDNAGWLRRHQVPGAVGLAIGADFLVPDSEILVRLVDAVHRARPMPHRPNAACGHLVRSAAGVVWFAGDTELHPGVADIPRLAGAPIDVAIVPISGWGPRLSAGHLNTDTAAQACALVGARRALPVHWGTLHAPGNAHLPPGWMQRPGPAFVEALARHAPECEPLLLTPGQSWEC